MACRGLRCVLVAAAPYLGSSNGLRVSVALLGVSSCGNGSSYGESAALGYLGKYPGKLVGAWSAGTGMSGVLASLIYLGLLAAGLSNSAIFLVSLPLVLVYWSAYYYGLVMVQAGVQRITSNSTTPSTAEQEETTSLLALTPVGSALSPSARSTGSRGEDGKDSRGEDGPQAASGDPSAVSMASAGTRLVLASNATATSWRPIHAVAAVGSTNEDTSPTDYAAAVVLPLRRRLEALWPEVRALHRLVAFNCVNLMLVYVAEYAAQLTAPFAFPCAFVKPPPGETRKFLLVNSYVVTQLCYQLGVLCSRSSLACVRVRRVEILTALQCINAVLWFIQAKTLVVAASPGDSDTEEKLALVLFAYMFFVGLLGGASYVNVFYNIREELVIDADAALGDDTAAQAREVGRKKELAMNIGALYAVAGITTGSVLDVIFTNTVITRSC